ncbi:probable RNA-directed DNA polymerase from transposon X-element [Trichonephila clavipes]|nr:probable RNA-directed DNA polymerase from transposon X-element [Trichonephila clavipes]
MWHDGLIYKLIKLKFPTYLIKIVHNYLDNRTFNVKINSTSSSIRNIAAGTPQGSILSPALYNIYTSDFPTTPSVSVCLFADDAAILCNSITPDQAVRTLQAYLSQLEIWLTKWRISINTEKTNAILFRKKRTQTMPIQLKLFDETIDWTYETSYLGLILNHNLTYRPHFNEIKKKYWSKHFSLIELLGKKSKLSLKNRIFIFKTYLRPILTYGCAIWGAAGNNHLEDLQRLQNKVLRIIARAPRFIPRSVLHEELRVEPIHTLIANLSSNFHSSIPYHNNPTINSQNYFRNLPPSTHRMPHSSANISPSF